MHPKGFDSRRVAFKEKHRRQYTLTLPKMFVGFFLSVFFSIILDDSVDYMVDETKRVLFGNKPANAAQVPAGTPSRAAMSSRPGQQTTAKATATPSAHFDTLKKRLTNL